MSRVFGLAFARAGFWLVVLAVTGCGQLPLFSRGSDSDSLYNAIALDDVAYVQARVESGELGVNQRIPAPGYAEGTPLLTIAARSASLRVLQYLLLRGANVNARTPAGETALMLAAYFSDDDPQRGRSYERHEQAVRILVAAGANLENGPYYYTPLSYAAYQGHDRIVRFLIARGARVDADAQDGITYINTPLMMAAMMGHLPTVRRLLQAGADPRIRVYRGHTALEFAMKYNHGELVPLLQCAERLAGRMSVAHAC